MGFKSGFDTAHRRDCERELMAINFRDNITFLFNRGRGIRAVQIADVDVPALHTRVDDIKNQRLGFFWRFAVKRSQDFVEDDFLHLTESSSSEYPELDVPVFAGVFTYFGAIVTPMNEPEASVRVVAGFSSDFLAGNYRRRLEPLYINDVPHRLYIGRFYLTPVFESGQELKLELRLRLSRYGRYVITTPTAAVPAFPEGWTKSYSPVAGLGDFAGQDRFVHIALPHGAAPVPTYVSAAEDGASNIAGDLTLDGSLVFLDTTPYAVYSSDSALSAATYSGKDLVVLPERDGIFYHVAPTQLPNNPVGFTWYAGFYGFAAGSHPLDPIDSDFISDGIGVSQSTMDQITMPDSGHDASYGIDRTLFYVRFIAQPASAATIEGVTVPVPTITYTSLADIQTVASNTFMNRWITQPNTVEINGVTYNVYLNRVSTNQYTRGGRDAEQMLVFREMP